MAVTNFDAVTTAGDVIVGGTTTLTGALTTEASQVLIKKISQTVAFGDLTDVTTTGTIDLTDTLPVGATVLRTVLAGDVTGFAGDTSAVIIVGDGSDTDRYSTGTPDVFSDITGGLDLGVPSGVQYHAVTKTITVTITTAADFTSVSAGGFTIEIYYIT